jgi:6-phosphofructokinase 1
MTGLTDGSIAILRTSNHPYRVEKRVVRLADVAAKTKTMPPEFIQGHNNVTKAFLDYCRPLVGDLPTMFKLTM